MELTHCDVSREIYLTQAIRAKLKPNKPYKCVDCGQPIWKFAGLFDTIELHHRVPLSYGGFTEKKNLIKLCHQCHLERHKALGVKPELPLFRKGVTNGKYRGIFKNKQGIKGGLAKEGETSGAKLNLLYKDGALQRCVRQLPVGYICLLERILNGQCD